VKDQSGCPFLPQAGRECSVGAKQQHFFEQNEDRHRSRAAPQNQAKTAAKVVENQQKPAKQAQFTKKIVEIPDFPLTTGATRPHREFR
jgi:hypothetical protein